MAGIAGVTTIETRAAGVTVRFVVPVMDPRFADKLTLPTARLVASPWVPAELLTVAITEPEELQFTAEVRSCVLPSV